MCTSNQSVDEKPETRLRPNQDAQAQGDDRMDLPTQEGLSDSDANPEDWNAFLSAEINHFVRGFQGIEIVVAAEDSGEAVSVLVHAPYMLPSVTIVDSGPGFDRLRPRHQNRLRNVKAARESASAEVKEFLKAHLYTGNGQERPVADGRAELSDLRRLLQDAVERERVPAGKCRPYPVCIPREAHLPDCPAQGPWAEPAGGRGALERDFCHRQAAACMV